MHGDFRISRILKRPTSGVRLLGRPHESWGAGAVELIEIPTEEEIHDNIVAFGSRRAPCRQESRSNSPISLCGRMTCLHHGPGRRSTSRSGLVIGPLRKSGAVQFAVEFVGKAVGALDAELPIAIIDANGGGVVGPPRRADQPRDRRRPRPRFLLDLKGRGEQRVAPRAATQCSPISRHGFTGGPRIDPRSLRHRPIRRPQCRERFRAPCPNRRCGVRRLPRRTRRSA